jgi:hypothetical protein
MSKQNHQHDVHLIESRLAARMAGELSASLETMPHDVAERLRFARSQALSRALKVRRVAPASGATLAGLSSGGAAVLGGFVPWWQRAASALPLVMLVAGLLAIDSWALREQVVAAADFDAQLLADDLPPAAFSDPGFAEFIRSTPQP